MLYCIMGRKVKVVDFLYKHADWPQTNNRKESTEAIALQLHSIVEGVEPFLEGVTNTVEIPVVLAEWIIGTNYIIRKKFPLVLSWAFNIHKAQSKTLYLSVIDIGKSEIYYGMALVAFYWVHKSEHLLLNPFTLEQKKSNRSNYLATIQISLQTLHVKFQDTKVRFNHSWNE